MVAAHPGLPANRRWCAPTPSACRSRARRVELVFSNLALQWCEPARVFAEAARALTADGLILFSTFGPDTLRELRAAFAEVDGAPHVNRFVDMHDLGDALVHAGFSDPVMEMERITLEYDSVARGRARPEGHRRREFAARRAPGPAWARAAGSA